MWAQSSLGTSMRSAAFSRLTDRSLESIIPNPSSCFQERVFHTHFPVGAAGSRVGTQLAQGPRPQKELAAGPRISFLPPSPPEPGIDLSGQGRKREHVGRRLRTRPGTLAGARSCQAHSEARPLFRTRFEAEQLFQGGSRRNHPPPRPVSVPQTVTSHSDRQSFNPPVCRALGAF